VFDTNVVVSASFWQGAPFHCLSAWAEGHCEAVISPQILAEYHENMDELRGDYPGITPVEWVAALGDAAELIFPMHRASGATADPDDEKILEAALSGEVDCIVSGDKKHLLALKMYEDIPILGPAEFLRRVR
jgi:putative PIN family toxin of toxin-antitoxin system